MLLGERFLGKAKKDGGAPDAAGNPEDVGDCCGSDASLVGEPGLNWISLPLRTC